MLAISPHEHARQIVDTIENVTPAWEQEYLSDSTRQELNDKIPGLKSDIPECTFGFEARIMPPTFADVFFFRRSIEIEYTSNPAPPEWQGPITRHYVAFDVGVNKMYRTSETKKVLHYYFE